MTEPTDDFYIAIAMLHGAEIESGSNLDGAPTRSDDLWYWNGIPHEIQEKHLKETTYYGWASRGELARAYCEYHKLV